MLHIIVYLWRQCELFNCVLNEAEVHQNFENLLLLYYLLLKNTQLQIIRKNYIENENKKLGYYIKKFQKRRKGS